MDHCHKLIRSTAKALAHEIYEQVMRDNSLWAQWKAQCPELTREMLEYRFVRLLWPKLVDRSRATLAQLLSEPISEVLKAQIHDALIKDNLVRAPRRN